MSAKLESLLLGVIAQLKRIADCLESHPNPAPDIVKDIGDYEDFDWSSINAEIVASDRHGPIAVRHGGQIYIRRNPANKFGVAIWYSRAAGKDGDETTYARLITFKEVKIEADPLNDKTIALLRRSREDRPASKPTQAATQQPQFAPSAEAGTLINPLTMDSGGVVDQFKTMLQRSKSIAELEAAWAWLVAPAQWSQVAEVPQIADWAKAEYGKAASRFSKTDPVDVSDLIAQTDVEMNRIGWTATDGRRYLQQAFNLNRRQELSPEQLAQFLAHLKSLPNAVR